MTAAFELDTEAAATVHFTDPRVRQLAAARWRMQTGGTHQAWLELGKDNPEALIAEAKQWIRAAVAAGILAPPLPNREHQVYDEAQRRRAQGLPVSYAEIYDELEQQEAIGGTRRVKCPDCATEHRCEKAGRCLFTG
jgi:hypothetical protein